MDLQLKGVWSSEFASQVADTRNALRQALILAREYKRDADGQFSSGGGGDDDDEGSGVEDEEVNPYNDSSPVSEHDVDEDGNPRFSSSYRERYGSIVAENGDFNGHYLAKPERGKLHIADDSNGSRNREVLQEFTPSQARSLSDDVYEVSSGGTARTNKATGVKLEPNERRAEVAPIRGNENNLGVSVTWSSGARSHFDNDAAFELQDALQDALSNA